MPQYPELLSLSPEQPQFNKSHHSRSPLNPPLNSLADMYEQIVKFGAYIVDGLREYTRPVMVYVPPSGELRGGAWAVVDPSINPHCMEMFADPTSRGGVLEAEGIVEIKFRQKDLLKTMHRVDLPLQRLKERLATCGGGCAAPDERAPIELEIHARESQLEPMYHQVAVHFADLHDTPERSLEKGCLSEIVPWRNSRRFFYWRLRRRLLEAEVRRDILETQPGLGVRQVEAMLRRWFVEDKGATESYLWDRDEAVASWLEAQSANETSVVVRNMSCVRRDAVVSRIREALEACPEVRLDAVLEIAHRMQPQERAELQRSLASWSSRRPSRRPGPPISCRRARARRRELSRASVHREPLRGAGLCCC